MAAWIKRLFGTDKCQSCETLREQLRDARLREQRMARQQEAKDSQIAMVLTKHYDRPVVQQIVKPEEVAATISHLMDVENLDDETFLDSLDKEPN